MGPKFKLRHYPLLRFGERRGKVASVNGSRETFMAKPDRLTIRIERDLADRLEAEAQRQRRTVADLARLTLADNLPPLRPAPELAEGAAP